MKIREVPIDHVKPYQRNPRDNAAGVAKVAASLREFGWRQPIVVDADMVIIAGHTRLLAARQLGLDVVPIHVAENLSPTQVKQYRLMDNRSHEDSTWERALLALELEDLRVDGADLVLTGFEDAELDKLLARNLGGMVDPDNVPAVAKSALTQVGDVWLLGRHRVMCGDATSRADVAALLAGAAVDLVLTDPPYCSGGYQEAQKREGSVGTDRPHKQIANDRLSTRGFIALLRAAFDNFRAPFLYSFTDWRMWLHLFDVAEGSGYGVRSMIVWNKKSPGMGWGWRPQHELILWGCREAPPYDDQRAGQGNVIEASRTGNKNHTTEKPVDLIAQLLANTSFCKTVADPFAGSGTTVIACEQTGRQCFGMELDPLYCDVIIRRWHDAGGAAAVLESTGQTFEALAGGTRRKKAAPGKKSRKAAPAAPAEA